MYISRENKFLVPVAYESIDNLEIIVDESMAREIAKEVEDVERVVEKNIEYLFFKVKDLLKMTSEEDYYKVFEGVYKSILLAHVNNVPCFSVIKGKTVNGMNAKKALEVHLAKFKKNYDFHIKAFECFQDDSRESKTLTQNGVDIKIATISNEISTIFKAFIAKIGMVSIEKVLNLHIFMIETIFNLLVNNVPCFEKAKGGIKGMTLEEKKHMHIEAFKKIFNEHVKLLNCN